MSSPTQHQVDLTHDGQAHWAGTGPANKTCRECAHFCADRRYSAASVSHAKGELTPAPCRLYRRRTGRLRNIPHRAVACKYFEQNDNPPASVIMS